MSAVITTPDELTMSMEHGNPFALIDTLIGHNLPLVVIGGYAVIYHGYVRTTEDVDVIFPRTPENEHALLAALSELEASWIGEEIDPTTGIEKTFPVTLEYIQRTHLMMLVTRYGYLDIYDFVPGIPHADVFDLIGSAERASGRPFVSLDWLKRMKAASDRPKDRQDLAELP